MADNEQQQENQDAKADEKPTQSEAKAEDKKAGNDAEDKKFTQAEVDRMIRSRAEQVASQKYGDYAELKAAKAELDKIQEANASDLEKAVKKAREEGAAEVQQRANDRLINAEARAQAAEQKFRNPGLAIKTIDLSGVKVDDNGDPDKAAIKALLSDLAKDEPYLIDDGKQRPKPDDAQGKQTVPAASNATPGLGRLREAYATSNSK